MSGDKQLSKASHYRARAQDLRTLAEDLKTKEREILLQVAKEYDEMAVHAELLELERDRSGA